jgi:hypothetical protein
MLKLSREAAQRAKSYLMAHGRGVDKRLYEFHFEGGSKDDMVEASGAFQNDDGGFGKALEPDLRTNASSAIATQHGFNYLAEVGADEDTRPAGRAIEYLLLTYDAERSVWPIIPPEVEDAPHAPWWSYEESADNFGDFLVNPRAALVGHLHHYASLVPEDFLVKITSEVLHHMETMPDHEMNMHDLYCYLTLAESLQRPAQDAVITKLAKVVAGSVENDPNKWSEYNLKPLAVAQSPDSLLASVLEPKALDLNLDFEISRQSEDGSWPLSWSWEFIDEAAWAQAEKDWKGHHIVQILKTLRAHGRFE